MRIGMLVDTYKPYVSGITNHIDLTRQALESLGHEVFIFTFGELETANEDAKVIRSAGFPLVDSGYYLGLRYNNAARSLLRTMDVVHVHHPFLSGNLALRYCRIRNIPIVFTNHTRYDLYAHTYLPNIPDSVSETFLQAYLIPFCRAVNLVISPSEGMRKVLQQLGVDVDIEVVPNGVDLSPFGPDLQPVSRQPFGFSDQDTVFIYAGRLSPEKNLPFLLQSFAGMVESYAHVKLLLIGDGPSRSMLEELSRQMNTQPHVYFTGMIPYEEIPAYLKMGDVFVTSSVTEVHPLSVIEAMAAGLPVLGIHSPGVGDTVEDGVNGFLCSENLASFTAKMVRIATEQNQRIEMGLRAAETAKTYDTRRVANLLVQHYQNVVEQAGIYQHGLKYVMVKLLERWKR